MVPLPRFLNGSSQASLSVHLIQTVEAFPVGLEILFIALSPSNLQCYDHDHDGNNNTSP